MERVERKRQAKNIAVSTKAGIGGVHKIQIEGSRITPDTLADHMSKEGNRHNYDKLLGVFSTHGNKAKVDPVLEKDILTFLKENLQ